MRTSRFFYGWFFFSIPALGIKGPEIKVPALSLHRTQRQGRGNREYHDSERLGQPPSTTPSITRKKITKKPSKA
jgi:hypothetical protein